MILQVSDRKAVKKELIRILVEYRNLMDDRKIGHHESLKLL